MNLHIVNAKANTRSEECIEIVSNPSLYPISGQTVTTFSGCYEIYETAIDYTQNIYIAYTKNFDSY